MKRRDFLKHKQHRLVLLVLLAGCNRLDAPATQPTISSFSATPAEVLVGEATQFSWQTTGTQMCRVSSGEGQPLTPDNCAVGSSTYTYTAPGIYEARLEATASSGARISKAVTVTVRALGSPGATFSTTSEGLTVQFDASASGAPADSTFLWEFGDGASGEGRTVSHTYEGPGDYLVVLTLSGSEGESSWNQTVTVTGNRVTLFGDGDLSAWRRRQGGAANWRRGNEGNTPYFEVAAGARVGENDLETKESFGDFRLHLEFWVPRTPAETSEQARGNSGVYLQGRYEVQILDSLDHPLSGANDAGAIYEVKDADQNASLPAETWQRYDIVFRAARFSDGKRLEPSRVSVTWNGKLVQNDVVIPAPTRLGDAETGDHGVLSGPIRLQDHGYRVRYRNIWLEPL